MEVYNRILNGRYGVTNKGHVFELIRDDAGEIVEKKPVKVYMVNGYKACYLMVHKEKKLIYIHKLVADNFVENDNPKVNTHVTFKDNNKENVDFTNLVWVSRHEVLEKVHSAKRHAIYSQVCKYCGVNSHKDVCGDCKKKIALENIKQKRLDDLYEEFSSLDTSKLSEMEKYVVELRASGCSLQEIGDEISVTRQRVEQILRSAKMKNGIPVRISTFEKNKLKTWNSKIKKLDTKINNKEKELSGLYEKLDTSDKKLLALEGKLANKTTKGLTTEYKSAEKQRDKCIQKIDAMEDIISEIKKQKVQYELKIEDIENRFLIAK